MTLCCFRHKACLHAPFPTPSTLETSLSHTHTHTHTHTHPFSQYSFSSFHLMSQNGEFSHARQKMIPGLCWNCKKKKRKDLWRCSIVFYLYSFSLHLFFSLTCSFSTPLSFVCVSSCSVPATRCHHQDGKLTTLNN